MTLRILTPSSGEKSREVTGVFFPGADGSFEVLDSHAPLIAALGPGLIRWECRDGSNGSLAVQDGFVEVKDNKITVTATE